MNPFRCSYHQRAGRRPGKCPYCRRRSPRAIAASLVRAAAEAVLGLAVLVGVGAGAYALFGESGVVWSIAGLSMAGLAGKMTSDIARWRRRSRRRRPTARSAGRRRSVAAVLVGGADAAEEIAAMLHDAGAAAGTRPVRLRWLDRCSGPGMWAGAIVRAWMRPLRSAWQRVIG